LMGMGAAAGTEMERPMIADQTRKQESHCMKRSLGRKGAVYNPQK
jgi:hypothetical protein